MFHLKCVFALGNIIVLLCVRVANLCRIQLVHTKNIFDTIYAWKTYCIYKRSVINLIVLKLSSFIIVYKCRKKHIFNYERCLWYQVRLCIEWKHSMKQKILTQAKQFYAFYISTKKVFSNISIAFACCGMNSISSRVEWTWNCCNFMYKNVICLLLIFPKMFTSIQNNRTTYSN